MASEQTVDEQCGVPSTPQPCRDSAAPCAERSAGLLPELSQTHNIIELGPSPKGKAVDVQYDTLVHPLEAPEPLHGAGPYGFFSRELNTERRHYLTIVLRPVVLVILLMWVCLPVFWGALANAPKLTSNLNAWYVNRDAARIGNTLWKVFSNTTAPGQYLGWINIDPIAAGTDEDIANAIVQNQVWVAVVVETNATINLSHARQNGDMSYDPRSAITVYYAQARQETAVGTYLLPIVNELLSSSVTAYATGSAQRYFAQITPDTSVNETAVQLLARAPQTISPGISWNMVNLRPYTSSTAQAVTLVGNIFLIIFAFVATMGHAAARSIIAPHLAFSSYVTLRIVVPLLVYIPLSMSYSLVSVAYGLPFSGRYTYGGGFMLAFVFFYIGMAALGLSLEAMITILTPKFVPYFLFILIIFNVAPVLLPSELMHPFYIYGTGFPVWNLSQALRTILFDTHSDLGRNAGVIVAWICLSCGTIAVFSWLWRRRELTGIAAIPPSSTRTRSGVAVIVPVEEKGLGKGKGKGKVVDSEVAYEK